MKRLGWLGQPGAVAVTIFSCHLCKNLCYTGDVKLFAFIFKNFSHTGGKGTDCKEAVEETYRKYKCLMFATAGKYTQNIEDQEDIVQTALERLIRIFSASSPQKCCISAGYVVAVIRSVSIEFLRKQGREAKYRVSLEMEQMEQIAEDGETMDSLVLLSEQAEQLWKIWPKLTEDERFLLEGKYILGYSDQQMAVSLKCSPGSIRMKLTRARRRAMKLLLERK